jgi:hypothetical protein
MMVRASRQVKLGPSELAMVKVSLDLPTFINAFAPNGPMHFVAIKFAPIVIE